MEKRIIEKVIYSLNENLKDKGTYIQFNSPSYKPIKISKENFHEIKDFNSNKKIAFIDGGNAEILKAPNFSLQLIRIYYSIYNENKKIKSKKQESYVLISATNKDRKIIYKTEFFGLNKHSNESENGLEMSEKQSFSEHTPKSKILDESKIFLKEKLEFDSFDETIRQGNHRISISIIGNVIRRFLELEIAKNLIEELSNNDIILIDGDLKASITNEINYFDELYKKAIEKNIIIVALSKTSELFTEKGNALIPILNEIAPNKEWYYHPLVEINNKNHKVDMYIIKLNKNSKYAFKCEISDNVKYNPDEVFLVLRNNSKDPVFLGYPYGLIEADKLARVSNREREYLKTMFLTKLGKNNEKISHYLNTLNAHTILDSVRTIKFIY